MLADLDYPLRSHLAEGIDVGVKADMYKLMTTLKKQGKAIIMISEELLELIGMSDRMLILKDGEISAVINRSESLRENDIIKYLL